jgi:hypothetical protein
MNMKTTLLVASTVLLLVASTSSWASSAPGHDFIFSNDIAKGAVHSSDIASNAVRRSDVHKGAIGGVEVADGGITSADIADHSILGSDLSPEVAAQLRRTYFSVVRDGEGDPTGPEQISGDALDVGYDPFDGHSAYILTFPFRTPKCAITVTPSQSAATVAAAPTANPNAEHGSIFVDIRDKNGRPVRSSFSVTLLCPNG